MTRPSQAALEWIRRSLALELPDAGAAEILDIALQIDAIAEHHHITTEEVIAWIHDGRGRAADYSLAAFRQHAKEFEELQRRLGGVNA